MQIIIISAQLYNKLKSFTFFIKLAVQRLMLVKLNAHYTNEPLSMHGNLRIVR